MHKTGLLIRATGLLLLTAISLLCVNLPIDTASAAATGGPWPMFHGSPQHTGRSDFRGPQTDNVKWTLRLVPPPVVSSPAVGNDGTIYICASLDNLYAVNPDGSIKWSSPAIGKSLWSTPAVSPDGAIYVAGDKLYAFGPGGNIKWTAASDPGYASSPTIGSDGTIYIGNNGLYAVSPEGSLKWRLATGMISLSSPALGQDGTVYVGSNDSNLYAVRPDGTLKWTYATGSNIWSTPAVGNDGTVYVGSWDSKLYALRPDGTLKWSFATGGRITSSPALGNDGTIYVGSEDSKFYAVNSDGSLHWAYTASQPFRSSAAIGNDGTIYAGCDNLFYAFAHDGSVKWSYSLPGTNSSPAIGSNGALYVGFFDRLCAFEAAGNLSINVNSPTVATMGSTYAIIPTASGGTPPYTWSSNNKPSWLALNPVNGTLTGIPGASAKSTTYTLTVTDRNGLTASKDVSIIVYAVAAPVITATTPTTASRGVPYILFPSVSGGTAPYTWSAVNMPFWLYMDSKTGVITGTPGISADTVTFTIQVRDKIGITASKDVTINVIVP